MNQLQKGSTAQIWRKRKQIDDPFLINKPASPAHTTSLKQSSTEPGSSNRILACYMAYEFLTRGTLLGHKLDPARSEPVPVPSPREPKKTEEEEPAQSAVKESYAEVSALVKIEGAHIPGIVNPTQLAGWIHM